MIQYRTSTNEENDQLKQLLWEYGPNEWNYLTPEGVEEEFNLLQNGKAQAVVAYLDSEIIGFAVLIDGAASPNYLNKYGSAQDMQFIGDVVVSSLHSGKGVATHLLKECLTLAKSNNAKSVFIERHEDNPGSAGMMRKAGFTIVDTFHDPQKRESGSQNSVILKYIL